MTKLLLKSILLLYLWILLFNPEGVGQNLLNCDDISFSNHFYKSTIPPSPYFYEMPFRLKERLIIIEAKVDNQKGYFIVDTGIENIVLNSRVKSKENVALDFCDVSGKQQMGQVKNIKFEFGNWVFKNQMAYVLDISHIEKHLKFPIMGLVGREILSEFEFHFDYQHFKIHLYKLDKEGNRKRAYVDQSFPIDTIPIILKAQLPYIKTKVSKKTFRLGLDSGASVNILLTNSPRRFKQPIITRETKFAQLGSTTSKQQLHFMNMPILVGNCPTLPMPFLIQGSQSSTYQYLKEERLDGLLGFYFFSQQKTAFNFRKRQLYLWKPHLTKKSAMDQSILAQNQQ